MRTVVCQASASHCEGMNGFIIEMTEDATGTTRRKTSQWIGIAYSASDMISRLPGHSPSVVDRGPEVMTLALDLGLIAGEIQIYHDRTHLHLDDAP